MKRELPTWVMAYLLILAAAGIIVGLLELLNPGSLLLVDGVDNVAGAGWGGRNLALGVTALVALLFRDRVGATVALAGAIAREVTDVIVALRHQDTGDLILPGIMLAIDIVAFLAVAGSAWSARGGGKSGNAGAVSGAGATVTGAAGAVSGAGGAALGSAKDAGGGLLRRAKNTAGDARDAAGDAARETFE